MHTKQNGFLYESIHCTSMYAINLSIFIGAPLVISKKNTLKASPRHKKRPFLRGLSDIYQAIFLSSFDCAYWRRIRLSGRLQLEREIDTRDRTWEAGEPIKNKPWASSIKGEAQEKKTERERERERIGRWRQQHQEEDICDRSPGSWGRISFAWLLCRCQLVGPALKRRPLDR